MLRTLLLSALVGLHFAAALPLGAAEAGALPAPERTWRHPAETYHSSVQRWFADLPPQLQYSDVLFQSGDDVRWAQPKWDDSRWAVADFWDLPARSGIHWMRFRVRMGEHGEERIPGGVMTSTVIAYELFWDGFLLGNSGVPAMTREAEIPGRVDNWLSIPAHLLGPGEHVVAIRCSSYRCGFPAAKSGLRFIIDDPAVLQEKAAREAIGPTLAAGALFMVGIAALIMWLLAARQPALLLLAAMCAAIAGMQTLHAVRWIFHYPADWHYPALLVMKGLAALQALFLAAFVVVHFAVPGRWRLAIGLAASFVLITWLSPARLNIEGVYLLLAGAVLSLGCAAWAAWHGRRDAWPSVIGISATTVLLLLGREDFRTNFFLKFLPAMLGLMSSLALHLHNERRRADAARLAAARLELELLKKNIQPHFLLNTLATILETIEQEPKTAAALVEALAGEFRILSRVAGEKLIPLAQEVELCRAHLSVMSLRRGVQCSLITTNVDEHATVPPALFHTLVENGLTHLAPREGRLEFVLRGEQSASATRYILLARGERSAAERSAPVREGTGLRYIKARLAESFGHRWSVAGGPVPDGWETIIEIGVRAAAADATNEEPSAATALPHAGKPA
jgi:hypothetical protein